MPAPRAAQSPGSGHKTGSGDVDQSRHPTSRTQTHLITRETRSVTTTMATDYDAPRKTDDELSEDSIEELKARRADKNSGKVDEDETEAAEGFELPGADLSNEELSVRVLPRQDDEFTCTSCFLVHHRTRLR